MNAGTLKNAPTTAPNHSAARRRLAEATGAGLSAACALLICLAYAHSMNDPLQYTTQNQLNMLHAAVFFAAGHGLCTADIESVPHLSAFFRREADAFDLAHIPDDLKTSPVNTPFELTHLYYLASVGWWWRFFGVSINALILYMALMHAVCGAALYGLFRMGLSRTAGVLAAVLTCSSPPMLYMSLIFRDFAKAPLLLGFLFLLTLLIQRPLSRRRLMSLAGAMGLWLGLGLGFRQDLLICLPPAAAILLVFVQLQGPRSRLLRTAALLLFLSTFTLVAAPVLRGMALEGNQATAHIFFQGTAPDVESSLDFGGASYEHLGWSDAGVFAQVNAYARRMGEREPMINPNSAEYKWAAGEKNAPLMLDPSLYYNDVRFGQAARALMREMIWRFPADYVARAWRTVIALFDMPLHMHRELMGDRSTQAPILLAAHVHAKLPPVEARYPDWLQALLFLQGLLARHISRFGLGCTLLALAALSAFQWRTALCLTGLLLWFAGYPSLLFEYRHCFYLVFIPIWASIACVERPVRFLFARCARPINSAPKQTSAKPLHRCGAVLAYLALLLSAAALPLAGLRVWQQFRVQELASTLATLERVPVAMELKQEDGLAVYCPQQTLPGLENAQSLPPGETAWEYVAAVFDTHGEDIPITVMYDRSRHLNNFTQQVHIRGAKDAASGRVALFFPIYETTVIHSAQLLETFMKTVQVQDWLRFLDDDVPLEEQEWWRRGKFYGIAFPEEHRKHFQGFQRIVVPPSLPVLPFFQIPEDASLLRTCKTGPWERWGRRIGARICRDSEKEWTKTTPGNDAEPTAPVLDKMLLAHLISDMSKNPLARSSAIQEYIEEWRERLRWLPDMSDLARDDLAREAECRWALGQLEDALAAYEASRELGGDDAWRRTRLAQLMALLDRPGEALTHLHAALLLQPFLPEISDMADALHRQLGHTQEQEAFWRDIVDRHPAEWFIGMRLGRILEDNGRLAEAAQAYGRVREAHPEHPDTCIALARCLGRIGQQEAAFDLVMGTRTKHPETEALAAGTLSALGDFLEERGDLAAAEKAFSLAAACNAANPERLLRLGDAQRRNHNHEDAQRSYAAALALAEGQNESLAIQLRERLDHINQNANNP